MMLNLALSVTSPGSNLSVWGAVYDPRHMFGDGNIPAVSSSFSPEQTTYLITFCTESTLREILTILQDRFGAVFESCTNTRGYFRVQSDQVEAFWEGVQKMIRGV